MKSFAPKMAKQIVSFGGRRPPSALQNEPCTYVTTWSLFSGYTCSFQRDNPLPENCTISPGNALLHQYQLLVSFTSINNAIYCRRVVVLPPCCLEIRFAPFLLIGVIPIGSVQGFGKLSCLFMLLIAFLVAYLIPKFRPDEFQFL